MAGSARIQAEKQFNRIRRGAAARLLGTGLLLAHIGVFLVAATALILINLYRHPSELTIGGALRTWAAIVAFHALIVALYPVVRWSVVTSELEGHDPLQRLREASTRLRPPTPRNPSAGGRVPLATRVRSNLTQPISLDAFQGQSVQAIWQRVTVRWQRLTNGQVVPPSDSMSGGGQPYQNGYHATITAESGAYEVVAANGIASDSRSPARSWPRRNGTHATNGASTSASSHQVAWPPRPGVAQEPPAAPTPPSESQVQPQPPTRPAEPTAADGVGANEAEDSPRWAQLNASASWLARPEPDEPESSSHEDGTVPVRPETPLPPASE